MPIAPSYGAYDNQKRIEQPLITSLFHMQFVSNTMYLIRMDMSKNHFSFLQLYEGLKKRYGEPYKIRYRKITWFDGERYLILERSTTVKYIDMKRIPGRKEFEEKAQTRNDRLARDLFIDNL